MRNVTLLLLGVAAWQPGAGEGRSADSAVREDAREDAVDVSEVTVTDAERRRMEDSVQTWVKMTADLWVQGDSAGLMDTYLPGDSVVVASEGEMIRTRDLAAMFAAGLGATSERKNTYQIHKIDVLAPGVAAVALSFQYQGKAADKQPFNPHGVHTAVLAERDGRLRIIQEHQSRPPAKK
jgi:hypothetical protein